MRRVLRDLDATEPDCYFAGNTKADVISITNMELVLKLFSCLSGQTVDGVKKCFKRTLAGTRHNHRIRVIVSQNLRTLHLCTKKSVDN